MEQPSLKNGFLRFAHAHNMLRHFRSHTLWESLHPDARQSDMAQALSQRLVQASRCEGPDLLRQLDSSMDGISAPHADRLRAQVGSNELGLEKPMPWWQHLWHCYRNPFNLLLSLLAAVSWWTEDLRAALVIGCMVLFSTLMRFVQEARSNRAADALKAMVSNKATVMRRDEAGELAAEAEAHFEIRLHPHPPRQEEVSMKSLVPGDVLVLAAGDMIPADARVLVARDLFIGQAAMTGESLPVEKFAHASNNGDNPLALDNLLFMGTNVLSGSGLALVLETGSRSYFGTLAHHVSMGQRGPTAFQTGVNKVSWLLIRFMAVMAPLVLLINGFTKGDWVEASLFALSIAVGLTPEMLPMIVTSTLAKGAMALSRQRVIVKRLDAIQNFGAMDVLCTDKTGTLTQDRIVLERHIDVQGRPSAQVLRLAYLNSHYQTGLRNLLDVAVLEHVELHEPLGAGSEYEKVDELPFDFQRRRMSVVVGHGADDHELICKGAVEEVLSVCERVQDGEQIALLDAPRLAEIQRGTAELNGQGLRVVAVAMKQVPASQQHYSVADESGLTLVGFIAFLDPPKESTAPALRALEAHGIELKILTGDNELVTAKICSQVGLPARGVVLGSALEAMDEPQFLEAVRRHNIFAKLSPLQKERVVAGLRQAGHVVGFLGDGINDAPALRCADIGISVDSAVDIAKEAADIILLEKSLLVLDAGVVEGRRTFANMLKYIKMTASSNFGNVFSVLIASAFLPFLPMLPLQLLVQNLLYDFSQGAIPFDRVDAELLVAPQHWNPEDIGRFMIWFGPVSSLFDIVTFALLWTVFGADGPAHQTLFQSGWFVEGLLSQTLIVHMIRTRQLPFVRSRASPALSLTTAAVMLAGIALPMGPLATYFRMQPLPPAFFGWLLLILLAYMGLTQLIKTLYARLHGWQ